jgi:hypothetical protein
MTTIIHLTSNNDNNLIERKNMFQKGGGPVPENLWVLYET